MESSRVSGLDFIAVNSPAPEVADRVPPGQYVVNAWPVLSIGFTPEIPDQEYILSIASDVTGEEFSLTAEKIRALGASKFVADIHCVTTWSRLDVPFVGILLSDLIKGMKSLDEHTAAVIECYDGYTTNLPLTDLSEGRSWLAWEADGLPLTPEHGGPFRLLVPDRYLWKSAKWVRKVRLTDREELGYFEQRGYHAEGDPWREERHTEAATPQWSLATLVDAWFETPNVRTLRLQLEHCEPHVPGQHMCLRFETESGFVSRRYYSISSAPSSAGLVDITVEQVQGGEVSPHLHEVQVGETIMCAGPSGSDFLWQGETPVLLIGGGSGVVPLMSMARTIRDLWPKVDWHLLGSFRSPKDVVFPKDLDEDYTVCYTRESHSVDLRPAGRITVDDVLPLIKPGLHSFVCGSSGFVDHVGAILTEVGVSKELIRLKRYGPGGVK